MNKNRLTASEEMIVNDEQIRMLKERNKNLKPRAVLELRKRGFSYDSICRILQIGKVTAIKIVKKKDASQEEAEP